MLGTVVIQPPAPIVSGINCSKHTELYRSSMLSWLNDSWLFFSGLPNDDWWMVGQWLVDGQQMDQWFVEGLSKGWMVAWLSVDGLSMVDG